MGLRAGGPGAGTWGFIGGKSEIGESLEETAQRESGEEVGIRLKNLRYLATTRDYRPETDRRYRVFFVHCTEIEGEPVIQEPNKMKELKWFRLDELPAEIFPTNLRVLKLLK